MRLFHRLVRMGNFDVTLLSLRSKQLHDCCLKWPSTSQFVLLQPEDNLRVEKHWDEAVRSARPARDPGAKRMYMLSMFPYPSGNLHMGHVRVYTVTDVLSRYYSLAGYDVIQPMGWDAFGLPAENAAIERKLNPSDWTESNIESMRQQLHALGCRFDWSRELKTCDPSYYKWTQWLFLRLYEAGLVTRRRSKVNWDPIDKTVLADEQIDENGRSWRSGAVAEKRVLNQWFVRTTKFAKPLYDNLDQTEKNWRNVVDIQQHWIGDCDAIVFHLPLLDTAGNAVGEEVDVHIAQVEGEGKLAKALAIAVSTEHVLASDISPTAAIDGKPIRLPYIAAIPGTDLRLPIFVSNAIDFHKTREYTHNCRLITTDDSTNLLDQLGLQEIILDASLLGSSKSLLEDALTGGWGGYATSWKLKDWVVSRQRFWGTPIPFVHCESCGVVPVVETELPVCLPDIHTKCSVDAQQSPLGAFTHWKATTCPKCGGVAERDTDTLDTFFDSSWYFLRYLDPSNSERAFSESSAADWMPVGLYVGGIEHAALHLFYARFIGHFLHSISLLKSPEPFDDFAVIGVVRGKTFQVSKTGSYLTENEVTRSDDGALTEKSTGEQVVELFEKMSKSKRNGVSPESVLGKFGTDLTRMLVVSDAPPFLPRDWTDRNSKGLQSWLSRVYWTVNALILSRLDDQQNTLSEKIDPNCSWEKMLKAEYNRCMRLVSYNLEVTRYINVAIMRMNSLTNALRKCPSEVIARRGGQYERGVAAQVVMSSILAPHVAAEFWAALRTVVRHPPYLHDKEVWDQPWPLLDVDAELELKIKVNRQSAGKHLIDRPRLEAMTEAEFVDFAMAVDRCVELLRGRPILGVHADRFAEYGAVVQLSVAADDIDESRLKRSDRKRLKKLAEAVKGGSAIGDRITTVETPCGYVHETGKAD